MKLGALLTWGVVGVAGWVVVSTFAMKRPEAPQGLRETAVVQRPEQAAVLPAEIVSDPALLGKDYDVRMDEQGNFLAPLATPFEMSVCKQVSADLRSALDAIASQGSTEALLDSSKIAAFDLLRAEKEKAVYQQAATKHALPDARIPMLITAKVNRAVAAYFEKVQSIKREELEKMEKSPSRAFSKVQMEMLAEDLAQKRAGELVGLTLEDVMGLSSQAEPPAPVVATSKAEVEER